MHQRHDTLAEIHLKCKNAPVKMMIGKWWLNVIYNAIASINFTRKEFKLRLICNIPNKRVKNYYVFDCRDRLKWHFPWQARKILNSVQISLTQTATNRRCVNDVFDNLSLRTDEWAFFQKLSRKISVEML